MATDRGRAAPPRWPGRARDCRRRPAPTRAPGSPASASTSTRWPLRGVIVPTQTIRQPGPPEPRAAGTGSVPGQGHGDQLRAARRTARPATPAVRGLVTITAGPRPAPPARSRPARPPVPGSSRSRGTADDGPVPRGRAVRREPRAISGMAPSASPSISTVVPAGRAARSAAARSSSAAVGNGKPAGRLSRSTRQPRASSSSASRRS